MIARTPGTLSASAESIALIVAWAYGLRTMSSQSWPGRFTSSMYSPAPRMKRGSSLRLTEWPMPPISGLVRSWRGASSVVISSSSRSAGRGRCGRDVLAFGGRGGDLGRGFALAEGSGRLLDRLDDVDVAGAATQVAADPVADLRLGRVVVLAKQPVGLHDHPRRAEPALEPVLVPERLLQRVEGAPGRHPFDRLDLTAVGLDREHGAALGALAVDLDRACAAVAGVATDVCPGQAEVVAQEVDEQETGLDVGFVGLAVDRHGDVLGGHRDSSCRLDVSEGAGDGAAERPDGQLGGHRALVVD